MTTFMVAMRISPMTDLFHNPGNAGNGSFDVSIGSTGPVPQPKGRGRVRGEDFGLPGRDSLTDLAATDPAVERRGEGHEHGQRRTDPAAAGEREGSRREHELMDDRECCGLAREWQPEAPDREDAEIDEDGKRALLILAGEVAADPRALREQWPFAGPPGPVHLLEHGDERHLVVVVPEEPRIVPGEDEADRDDGEAGEAAREDFVKISRRGGSHAAKDTVPPDTVQ